ncbi:histidine kinase, partial [Chroococcidiopsis cubana CCALA 043]
TYLCQITVEDNGIGFDQKYCDRIFQVFQRLHGRSEYEGTGIGLAICRKIVERHGGSIAAESKPSQGAKFIVTLPMHQSID